jgi:diadenosine tetraphosphatase ApaH/serine/threonine PP2A family protein phosphatase
MRVAVVSDIHSNLVALEAVLAAIDEEAPDELWCLGDLVGYGPRPNECTRLMQERTRICLCGNHDLAVRGTLDLWEFSGDAGMAARWTRTVLNDEALAFLNSLKPSAKTDDAALFHGSARDPVWEYVLSGEAALMTLAVASEPIVLVGHSHVALQIQLQGDGLDGGLAADGTKLELADARSVLNPGSVGQPRDGDPRAAYLVLDLEAQTATFRRVAYDIERTQAQMAEAGLPEALALRLAVGQ